MVKIPISNQYRLNFVELGLKSAARADEYSLVNQCSHKIDFSLYRAKKIPAYILPGKSGFSIHRYTCDKPSFVLLNQDVKKWEGRVKLFFKREMKQSKES